MSSPVLSHDARPSRRHHTHRDHRDTVSHRVGPPVDAFPWTWYRPESVRRTMMRTVPWVGRIARRACLLIVTAVPLTAGALPDIDPRVFEALETDATARVLVTVSIEDEGNKDLTNPLKVIEAVLGETDPESRRIGGLPVVLTEIDQDGLEMLQSEARIASIFLDKPERLTLDSSSAMMNVPPVYDQGFTGTGQVVAVLDTGVDAEHGFLAGKVVAEGCFSSPPASVSGAVRRQSLCPNGLSIDTRAGAGLPCDEPADQCAHGTHVAGIATGVHMDTATFNGSGIAKGSDLVAIQVFTRFDDVEQCKKSGRSAPCLMSYPSDQLEALEYVRFLAYSLSIAAVNISIGGERREHACDDNDPRAPVIEDLRAMGIATVISSGNDSYYNAVRAPGCISSALTVGAAQRNSKDLNTDFSNTSDLVDFIAPGTNVISSVPGGFGPMTGTSMAAPHIAGLIALLRSQYPEASVAQMEFALKMTSDQTEDPRTGVTLNFPHVADAANMLQIATLTDQHMQAPRTDSFATLLGATRIIIIPPRAAVSTATYELVKEVLDESTHLMVKTSGTIVAERAQGFDEVSLNQLEETLTIAGSRPRVYRDTPEALY